jgi:hypothetical protein
MAEWWSPSGLIETYLRGFAGASDGAAPERVNDFETPEVVPAGDAMLLAARLCDPRHARADATCRGLPQRDLRRSPTVTSVLHRGRGDRGATSILRLATEVARGPIPGSAQTFDTCIQPMPPEEGPRRRGSPSTVASRSASPD